MEIQHRTILMVAAAMTPVALASGPVTLSLDRGSQAISGTVNASGTATPDTRVSLKVLGPAVNVVVFDAVKADGQGNYSISFKVPATVSAGQTLTVIAGYGASTASRNLVVSDPTVVAGSAADFSVTMGSGNTSVDAGNNKWTITLTRHGEARGKPGRSEHHRTAAGTHGNRRQGIGKHHRYYRSGYGESSGEFAGLSQRCG